MRYLMTFIWAVLLLKMVNFVLNSLKIVPELNVINPILIDVIFTIVVAILDPILKPSKGSNQYES